jgi:hypothetical protein
MRSAKLLCLALAASWMLSGVPHAYAGCAVGPMISVSAGATGTSKITIKGTNFKPCNDVVVNGYRPPDLPYQGIKVFFVQGKLKEQVAKVDADRLFAFTADIALPAKAASGPARLVVDYVSREVEFDLKMGADGLQIVPRVQTRR